MIKKRCLFCDKIVFAKPEGDLDRFMDCYCAPGGSYCLEKASYDPIQSLPHQLKRNTLHIISAYIREKTDCGEQIILTAEAVEAISNLPEIPVAIEDKGSKLLQYIYRHSSGPEEPVVIQPLSNSYNLTYSHNLQELVYILDKLVTDQLLIREGMTFKLTEKGWREASAASRGKALKPCLILLPEASGLSSSWQHALLPKIEQLGYIPRLHSFPKANSAEALSLEMIADSHFVIAELGGQLPEIYFSAGYALGQNIPVIWTLQQEAEYPGGQIKQIRPLVWTTPEELADFLQQRLLS